MSRQATVGRTGRLPTTAPLKTPPAPALPVVPVKPEISTWSWGSPSTWPKWLIALVIGVPLTVGGAYWIYSQQRRRPSIVSGQTPSGKTGRKHVGDGDKKIPSFSSKIANEVRKEPKSLAENIAYLKSDGNKLFREKRYLDAKKCYSEAIELASQNGVSDLDLAQSLQNRAACNEQLKHFDEVITDCTAAIQIDKHYVKAYARRSRVLERRGQLKEAVYDLMAASILTSFQNTEYRERSEKLLNEFSAGIARETVAKRVRNGFRPKLSRTFVRQFNHGFTHDPVCQAVEAAQASDSDRPIDLALRAFGEGDYDRVIDLCTEAMPSAQTLPRLLRATMYFLFGNTKEARVDLDNVITSAEASLEEKSNARIKLACLLLQEHVEPEQVLSRLNEAVELDPTNSDILFHRGQCYMLFSHFDLCLKDFRRARELQGNNDPTCSFHIAHIEYRIRSNDNPADPGPLNVLEEKLVPLGTPEAFVLLGQLFLERRDFDKAQLCYQRALMGQDDPHNAVVFTQQAMLEMMWHEDKHAAQDLLQKALRMDPHYSSALELMMDLELQAENMDVAKQLYERCLDQAKSEVEMLNIIQAYQIALAGQFVYADLGIAEQSPLRA